MIPLDGRPHIPHDVRLWNGDSRGHWEHSTLAVDTTNFVDKVSALQPWAAFSSVSARAKGCMWSSASRVSNPTPSPTSTTDDDPKIYTKRWTVTFPMVKSDRKIDEYACHESNYGMFGMLAGARAEEKAAADAAKERPGSR